MIIAAALIEGVTFFALDHHPRSRSCSVIAGTAAAATRRCRRRRWTSACDSARSTGPGPTSGTRSTKSRRPRVVSICPSGARVFSMSRQSKLVLVVRAHRPSASPGSAPAAGSLAQRDPRPRPATPAEDAETATLEGGHAGTDRSTRSKLEADAGDLDPGRLRRAARRPGPVRLEAAARGPAQREQHLEHVLHETERARNESEANLAEHRKQMARAADEVRGILDKARQDAQATGRADRQAGPGRGRGGQAAGSARHRAGPRPGPGRNLAEDRRHGRLGRRQGPLQGTDRHRASPLARRRHQGAAGRAGVQRARRESADDRRERRRLQSSLGSRTRPPSSPAAMPRP